MKKFSVKSKIIIYLIVIIILGLVGFKFYTNKLISDNLNIKIVPLLHTDYPQLQEVLKKRILLVGLKRAYEVTGKEIEKIPLSMQREVMFFFGIQAYRLKGLNAMAICDARYKYGCYHGVFNRAVAEKGLAFATVADNECKKYQKEPDLGLSCYHGIGRALMYSGGEKNLSKILEKCTQMSWKGTLFGCRDGVFIEYHFPFLLQQKTISTIKQFEESNPYDPCPTVPSDAKRDCYYIIPLWWFNALGQDYERMGSLCNALSNQQDKEACFVGIGRGVVALGNDSVEEALKACSSMPGSESRKLCLAAAHWTFLDRSKAEILCNSIPQEDRADCKDISKLEKRVVYTNL